MPANRRVKLRFRSEDDLHRFTVPKLEIEVDVIPDENHQTTTYLNIASPGIYPLFCSIEDEPAKEHETMKSQLIVHESGDFESWFDSEFNGGFLDCSDFVGERRKECVVAQGETVYQNHGCNKCHSVDGSAGVGPTFKGNWGKTRQFSDGSVGIIDEHFVRKSLKEPMARVRSGFEPSMPSFSMRERNVEALINWMKIL